MTPEQALNILTNVINTATFTGNIAEIQMLASSSQQALDVLKLATTPEPKKTAVETNKD